MHFYLALLLIKLAYYVEYISCFRFSAWSQPICYELTVEFNFNSMSTVIVLIVSIKIWRDDKKKILVLEK